MISVQVTKTKPPRWKRLKDWGKQTLAFVGGWLIDKVASWGLDGLWETVIGFLRPIFGRRHQPEQS